MRAVFSALLGAGALLCSLLPVVESTRYALDLVGLLAFGWGLVLLLAGPQGGGDGDGG